MTFCNLQAGEKQRDLNSANGERHEDEREDSAEEQMFDDGEGEQPGQVEEEGSDNDNKSNEAEDEDDEPQNEEDEKNEEDDRKEEEEQEEQEEEEEEEEEEEDEEDEEDEEEENANEEEKKIKLLANYSEKLQKALMGDLNSDFPDNVKIVRIFTSSTFTGKQIT